MCFEIDLLKSESSTASNMHGRGSQALSCSNLFPLINSHRCTGCHPLGWALAPHTTRPRSHGYGSLWGPSSNLCSVTPGACRSHHYNRSRSMHLADAFIQSDLQCIQAISTCVPGNRTHNLCAANTMLYH